MTKQMLLLSAAVVGAIVLVIYYPALKLGFFGDDYLFLEVAGRSSPAQYLATYFDPRVQTAWYRPMQGMRYGIIYAFFGAEPLAYHLVNMLIHLVNCLLLFAIVWRITRNGRVAMLAALLYAGLPLYAVAVFWPGVADFVMTLFFLAAVLSWVVFLQNGTRAASIWAFIFFIFALLTKELAVTLPLVLFAIDRVFICTAANHRQLLKRYAPYLLPLGLYLPMEYQIQARGIFVNTYGYGVGGQVLTNFVQYLAALAFPWMLPEPWNYVWLVGAISLFAWIVIRRKSIALLGLGSIGGLTLLPVVFFPWFTPRYLYLPVMTTMIFFAWVFEFVWKQIARWKWLTRSTLGALALIVFANGLGVQESAMGYAELARQTRVPFRDIAQRHPTFPEDTYLYFINPPTITLELSGMFFLRYGAGIHVASDEISNRRANLREHANAYVIYFDEQRRTRELPVEKHLAAEMHPMPPVDFAAPIRLEGYEMVSATVRPAEPIVLFLYWRGLAHIEQDYWVVIHLLDGKKGVTAQYESAPRRGSAPTSSWLPNELVADAILLSVPGDATPGTYHLSIALFDPVTQQPVNLLDNTGAAREPIVIGPVEVVNAK